MNTTLRIARTTSVPDIFRSYRVVLDGKVAGELKREQELVLSIPAGRHSLSVRIDWCGSPATTFEAKEGEAVFFECASSIADWRILFGLFYAIFLPNDYLRLRRKEAGRAAAGVAEIAQPPLLGEPVAGS